MSSNCDTDEEVNEHLIWKSEVYRRFGADLTSVNDFHSLFAICETTQDSLPGFPKSTLHLAAADTSSAMDARTMDTGDLHAVRPAVADSSSGSEPCTSTLLTACVWGTNELGSAVDASSLTPSIEPSEEKQIGQAPDGLEMAAVIFRFDGLDTQGDKHPNAQTSPGGGPKSRSVKPQAGDRSRFRPWGYI